MSTIVKTATSAASCMCCGTGTLGTLSSRQRGGTATLCGNSENAGFASTPPKKYRKKRVNGTMVCCFSSAPCNTPSTLTQQAAQLIYNNGNDYNALTCAFVPFNSNHTILCTAVSPPTPPICPTTVGCVAAGIVQPIDIWKLPVGPSHVCFSFASINGNVIFGPPTLTNAIQTSVTLVNFCCGSGGAQNITTTGVITELFSDEDTDTDAYNRAAPTFTWSAFTTALDSRVATQASRTTGFSFTLVDVEFQVDGTGFAPVSAHTVHVDVYRAIVSTGSYTLFQTLVYTVTADGSGNISFTDTVPNASGFDTFVTNPRIF